MNMIDTTMKMIEGNPAVMAMFAPTQSEAEIKFGTARLRENFRRIHYQKLATHNHALFGGLYQRADTIKAVNENERLIRKVFDKRVIEQRADASADGLIFARELERIDPRRFQVKYKPLGLWRDIMPQVDVPPGLDRITYRIDDLTGEVEPATVGRQKTVFVGASSEEFSNKVVGKTLGYEYTVMELHRAAFANVPLQDRYQQAVLRGYEKNLDKTMFDGDALESLEGLINHTGVTNFEAEAPATGSDKTWSGGDKTNDEKVADIIKMLTRIATQSQENYNSDRTEFALYLPRDPYNALLERMAAGTNITVLDFILENKKLNIKKVMVLPSLAGAGTGSTDLAIMMPIMDAEVIEAHVGNAVIWQPAQFLGLSIQFPSIQYHGGVVIRYAIAITQLYGI